MHAITLTGSRVAKSVTARPLGQDYVVTFDLPGSKRIERTVAPIVWFGVFQTPPSNRDRYIQEHFNI